MFILSRLRDTVKIPPANLRTSRQEAVLDSLNTTYASKVVFNLGLCVCVYDLESLDHGYVLHDDGAVYVKVTFRLVVFRPFKGEVLLGKINGCDEDGIHVSMQFFDDVFIPSMLLPYDSVFDTKENVWIWKYDGNDFYLDAGEQIRFRVVDEQFNDVTPNNPKPPVPLHQQRQQQEQEAAAAAAAAADAQADGPKDPPYRLIGSIQGDGLGLPSWW